MDPVAFDFETFCFAPGYMAPHPVCASTYHPRDGLRLWQTDQLPELCHRIGSERTPILGHGFAYDACVWLEHMPHETGRLLWEKYERDEILDTLDCERIIEIGTGQRGRLKLDLLAERYGVQVQKSCVQTDFGRYYQRPLSEYTREHKRYMGGDAAELYTLFQRQWSRGVVSRRDLGDLVRGSFWLRLCSNYGIRTDPTRVHDLERSTQEDVEDLTEVAQAWGAMQTRMTPAQQRDGKWYSRVEKVIKARVLAAYGPANVPRTDSWAEGINRRTKLQTDPRGIPGSPEFEPLWGVSISAIALSESGDPLLESIADLAGLLAVRNKDVKMLQAGVYAPIHTRFGWAASTRTTSSKPNLQNFRKKRGIRECLMPRDGCCFIETDYPSLELFGLAQVCAWKLKRYDLVQNMNAGRDYHAVIAASILGTTYDDVMARKGTDERVKNARDCGKYGNYGLCGYMTDPETFALYVNLGSRTEENPRGLRWSSTQAAQVMALWRASATDPVAFLRYVDGLRNAIGLYDLEIPGTSIMSRGNTRTAAANKHFQGVGAVVARRAGWRIARRQFITRDMPSRTVLFCHDAFLQECKLAVRDAVAAIQEEEMAAALSEVCPDMLIWPESRGKPETPHAIIDSAAQDHYSKFAKCKRDSKGSLIVCQV